MSKIPNIVTNGQKSSPSRSLFIFPALDWTRDKDPPFSLGQASIVANLNKHNIPVMYESFSVNKPDFDPETVVQFIMDSTKSASSNQAVSLGLGAFVWNERHIQHILDRIKELEFPGEVILGGPQISYLSSDFETYYPQVDIFVRGYAEQALVDLLSNPTSSSKCQPIDGVYYSNSKKKRALTMASPNFDNLPSPFLSASPILEPQKFIRWESQRGCPFRCSFCQHRQPNNSILKRRNFPIVRSIQEAKWIGSNPIIQDIAVLDPIFNSGPHYLEILDTLTTSKYSGKLALQARAEMVSPEFLLSVSRLQDCGASVTLEFGLQTIHKNEMKLIGRINNMSKFQNTVAQCNDLNIDYEISLIFGLPQQTLSSFQQTIEFCTEILRAPRIHAFPLMLLRGTPLFFDKELLGLVESSDTIEPEDTVIPRVQSDIPHVISCKSSFSHSDWQSMYTISEWLETDYNSL